MRTPTYYTRIEGKREGETKEGRGDLIWEPYPPVIPTSLSDFVSIMLIFNCMYKQRLHFEYGDSVLTLICTKRALIPVSKVS